MTVNKLQLPAKDNAVQLKINEIIDNLGGGGATDVQINGTSITSGGVANIVTNTAYNASSNKIATMSDLPADEIFVATYGTTTFQEVFNAYDAGKTVFVKDTTTVSGEIIAVLNYFEFNSALDAHFEFASSILNDYDYYTYSLDQDSIWNEYTEQIPDTSGFANTDLSNLTATGEAHFQEPLVSGTNIKTVNNTSLLGSGDISVGSYSAGTGLSLSGTTFNHSNSVTAGTIGTSSATSGSTISVPYATYDAQGHITGKGTHTHTVTGFLTSSSSEVTSSRFDGAVTYKYSTHSLTTSTGTKTISLSSYLPSGSSTYNYSVLVSGYMNNNSSTISIAKIKGSSSMTTSMEFLRAGSGGRYQQNSLWLPVDTGKTITVTVENGSVSNTLTVELCAYRRIGTNS